MTQETFSPAVDENPAHGHSAKAALDSSVGRDGANNSRLARLKARRKLWLQVHLWLGLIAGAWLVVIGLTGSILVFCQEIDELLNPGLMAVTPRPGGEAAFRPLDEIIAAARKAVPADAKQGFGFYPRHDAVAYKLAFSVPAKAGGGTDERQVLVDPYSAEVLGTRLLKAAGDKLPRTFIGLVFELHYDLWLGWDTGGPLVGIVCVLLIVSVLTGLIVWWPLTGKWRQALTLKRGASTERWVFDLHKTTGLYTALVLLALLESGIYMNLPEQFYTLVRVFSPAVNRYQVKSAPPYDRPSITLADAVRIVAARYPEGRYDWLYGVTEPDSAYTVCKHGLAHLSRFVGRACVVVDRYSGEILHVQGPDAGTAGDRFVLWQWPLHSGQAFGWTGRMLVFLAGLACPVIYITGVIRWMQKRRAKAT
ncbi:MAG: PepSY-associated TM helix domain-containing protein [Methylococcaceae bacterium]|nr:PepSY-associated TM helix domain-containing protein [Methylococcaceae bacterium]